ncbi:DUF6797 domain-containing protein [Lignipirellula cremea]|uniref:Cytochrome c n=1 Tax=Lignipirellula cremea TaxID=2528010 RepID=A0A518DLS1_9BACT|nr:DUF6797 domain-containing protein [Lignipirellula cremea]QDU92786.1 Cytochrome c [Lignipirellula cremea]
MNMALSRSAWLLLVPVLLLTAAGPAAAQDLETRLKAIDPATIAAQARLRGNPQRGAMIFFTSAAACVKCHTGGEHATPLGPDLATLGPETTDVHLVEAILDPSKSIRKGYETVSVVMLDGKIKTGLVAADKGDQLVLRDAANLEQEIVIPQDQIDERIVGKKSMMPQGLVAALHEERDFYDLVRYVTEVVHGGAERAAQLRPRAEDLIVRDDTQGLNHAGILRSLGQDDWEAGKRIYQGHCQNCHGADGNTPTLATARAFGAQELKYGADPYRMFLTLSRGAGLMTPMQHLSPRERYQVVHYIQQALMKPSNPAFAAVDDAYLKGLPEGSGTGEAPPASDRDYGPVLGSQLGGQVNNALTFRLSPEVTVSYDLHRMRLAGAWTGGFLDLSQTHHYRQRGERMPQIDGDPLPGLGAWQWAFNNSFDLPADAKPPRGPVREDWLQYEGHYLYGNQAVLKYAIEGRRVLETLQARDPGDLLTLHHTLRIEAGDQPLKLSVAQLPGDGPAGLMPRGQANVIRKKGAAGEHLAFVSGKKEARPRQPKMKNQPRHLLTGDKARQLDLGAPGRTLLVRFRSTNGGTLVASAPAKGEWKPNGKTLFLRGKKLVFDIGWVGALTGQTNVADGKWHTAALVVDPQATHLYVDGKREASRADFRRAPEADHVLKIGATATNFGGDYQGDLAWVRILSMALSADDVAKIGNPATPPADAALFAWEPSEKKEAAPAASPETSPSAEPEENRVTAAAAVIGDTDGLVWEIDDAGRIVLLIPASEKPRVFSVICTSVAGQAALARFQQTVAATSQVKLVDPLTLTQGGPLRWPERITVTGQRGEPINGYALDTIPTPTENPWNAWLRTSALDFFEDGRAVVTTHGGDVYLVSGIDDGLQQVVWKRFAAGLFEPFGVRVIDGLIYVTCRDGIKRLHDYNGDQEADFIEAFWNDDDVSNMFHAYNFDLQTDSAGNFYFAKAGQYSQHHRPGSIMRVPPAGGRAEVVAWGLRTPNGMGKLNDDRFTVSDNQGPWMPAGKISLIKPGAFLGNMPINDEQTAWLKQKHGGQLPDDFEQPLIWMPQELDNSCGGQVWVDDPRFGPLSGRLIHSSFGKGWLYYLSLQEVGGQTQASIVALPHQWDAGVMRLRVNPHDGQLYGTGLSGWQGPRDGHDGCLQRLRYTGEPIRMIENVRVTPTGLELTFNFPLDEKSVTDPSVWEGQMWDYLWSRKYGSDQFSVLRPGEKGRDPLPVQKVTLLSDRKLHLTIPDLAPCDQVSVQMNFNDAAGDKFVEHVYLTIHAAPDK